MIRALFSIILRFALDGFGKSSQSDSVKTNNIETATCPICYCANVIIVNGRFARHTTCGAQETATLCGGQEYTDAMRLSDWQNAMDIALDA